MLTIEKLKKMKPDTIIAQGFGYIIHPWFNNATLVSEGGALEEDKRTTKVKWIAVRGQIHDWAIYHSMDANICFHNYFNDQCHLEASDERILRGGAKLRDEVDIRKFVPCDDESFQMYRQ